VGSANKAKGLSFPHHNPFFDFDEEAMVLGAEIMAKAALSSAMGALSAKRVLQKLQILEHTDREVVERAQSLIRGKRVRIMRVPDAKEILIRSRVRNSRDEASAVIRGSHDHLVGVEKNGKLYKGATEPGENFWHLAQRIKRVKYSAIIDFVRDVDVRELSIVKQAMEMNVNFAKEAGKRPSFFRIGKVMEKYADQEVTGKNLPAKVRLITALAVEARMRGLDLPVMTCAGSGNQGEACFYRKLHIFWPF